MSPQAWSALGLVVVPVVFFGCAKAEVGASCEKPDGCVVGAQCLMKGPSAVGASGKPQGVCHRQCAADAECGELPCHMGLCQKVARLHEDCGENPCAVGECLKAPDGAKTCRKGCVHSDTECEAGEKCLFLKQSTLGLLSGRTDRYCLPAP